MTPPSSVWVGGPDRQRSALRFAGMILLRSELIKRICAASTSDRTPETAGSAVAPAVRCKNVRRGSFILNLPLASHHSITVGAGKGVTAGMMRLRVVYPIHMSAFQLAFELIEEAPIGGIGDDLVGERLDHACFA